jgi:hypothetical protein
MSGHSPIDSLRQLAPVSDSDAAALFGTAGCEELLDGVTQLPYGRSRRAKRATRRRRLVLALAIVALVGVATAATWVALRKAPARETTSVQCLIGSSDAIIPSSSGDPARDCAADYRREFGTSAPRLAAYDNGLGGVTVIPRTQKPQAGWKRLVSGQDVDLIQLQDSLDDYINGLNASCLSGTAATNLAESKLERFGFAGWTVKLRGATTPGLCFDMDIVDPSSQTVTLASFGAVAGSGSTEQKLAAKLRPITRSCESLPAAVAAVRAAASSLGLSESAKTYELNAVADPSLRCASIYETVGGTTFLTVRGPRR